MQSMHNDNTTVVLVCRCFQLFSLSLCVWLFSSRSRTPEGRARYSFLRSTPCFFSPTAWLGFGPFMLCAFTTCLCAFVCCCACIVAAEMWGCVCVCVFLWVYCKGTGMYGSSACSSSHLLPLYASMPPHPCFTQVFVYYIIVYCSVPQLTCSDTLHCSSMNSAATGGGGEDENQDRRRVDEYRETG